jgi:hypothetical protein
LQTDVVVVKLVFGVMTDAPGDMAILHPLTHSLPYRGGDMIM